MYVSSIFRSGLTLTTATFALGVFASTGCGSGDGDERGQISSDAGGVGGSGIDSSGSAGETGGDGSGSSGLDDSGGVGGLDDDDDGSDDGNQVETPEPQTKKIDLLFVIDNSGSTGEEQLNLARNFPRLVNKLIEIGEDDAGSEFGGADVQIMVTTTDFGNPLCQTDHHEPERGAPVTTSCTERIEHFTRLAGSDVETQDAACLDFCPETIELEDGANFLAFSGGGRFDNIKGEVVDKDINGDGEPEGRAAQALACIGPQGIDGCGFESPLEAMMQALYPGADWNDTEKTESPFLRDDALLAIAIITDEADCSINDYSVMNNEDFWAEQSPGKRVPSSAICWNQGVECTPDPDNAGWYEECHSVNVDNGGKSVMHPVTRYTSYLVDHLLKRKKKEVVMLGILGIPEVTAYSETEPKVPVEGGIKALQYRDWADGSIEMGGDILPEDFPGKDAAYKQWEFGVGPGCTGALTDEETGDVEYIGQAIPPVRIREVCEALDAAEAELEPNEEDRRPRCCMESICSDDFSGAIDCLVTLIDPPIVVD